MLEGIVCFFSSLQNSPTLGIVELIGNLAVISVTLYTTDLLFFSKRVSVVSVSQGFGRTGQTISLLLKNHTMRTLFIKSATLVVDGKYSILIAESDEPYHLESLGVLKIESEPFSELSDERANTALISNARHYAILETLDTKIYAKYWHKCRIDRHKAIIPISVLRHSFNGYMLHSGYKYALTYEIVNPNKEVKTLFIHDNGVMTDNLTEYDEESGTLRVFNGIPEETVQDIDKTRAMFRDLFEPFGTAFRVTDVREIYNDRVEPFKSELNE
jgi:hypothetical protein